MTWHLYVNGRPAHVAVKPDPRHLDMYRAHFGAAGWPESDWPASDLANETRAKQAGLEYARTASGLTGRERFEWRRTD